MCGDDIAFTIVCLAMPLLSPISWQHVFPLLALPMGLILARALQTSGKERNRLLSLLFVIFVLLSLPDFQLANYVMALYAPYRMPCYAGTVYVAHSSHVCLMVYALAVPAGRVGKWSWLRQTPILSPPS
jgi:hypothetical protein